MEKDKNTYQVIIVGGGPSGIAAAITLHSRGVKCCLIEANTHPVQKPGEAIPPNAKPLLKQLGLSELLSDIKHKTYHGNQSCWGSDQLELKEFLYDRYGQGYLLDRLHFETQLQTLVKKSEIQIYNGFKLKKVISATEGIQALIENEAEEIVLQGNLIIDATGRKASVCRHLGIRKESIDDQFAMTCTIQLSNKIPDQIVIEATQNGWWYLAPLHGNEITVMFFTLKELVPKKEDKSTFLAKELSSSHHISKIIDTTFTIGEIKIIPAGTSCLDKPYGDNWVAVGDASYSYDPISSYGITSALASGYYAGHAIADHLIGKKEALQVYHYVVENAFQAYLHKLVAHYDLEKRWKESFYWKYRLAFTRKEPLLQ